MNVHVRLLALHSEYLLVYFVERGKSALGPFCLLYRLQSACVPSMLDVQF